MSRFTVLEGGPLAAPKAKGFEDEGAMLSHVIERVQDLAPASLRGRLERALSDRIVSEDGSRAVSEVISGRAAFAVALARGFAPSLTVVTKATVRDEDED